MRQDKLVKRMAVLALSAVVALFSLEALAKKPTAPPPEEEPPPLEELAFDCALVVPDAGLDTDGDQYDDELECAGLDPTEDAFGMPSCCAPTGLCDGVPDKTLNCLDPRIKNYLLQFSPNRWQSFTTLGISNEDIIVEMEQGLAQNAIDVDELVAGIGSVCTSPTTNDHCVARAPTGKSEQPKWIVAVEDRTLGVSDCARPPPYGSTVVSSTTERSLKVVTVNTRVMEEHILVCIGGTNTDLRDHERCTTVHEFGHRARLTHFPAGEPCYLASATTFTRKGNKPPNFNIPDSYCQATIDAVEVGSTPGGPTHCGDTATETCATPTP